MDKLQQLHFDNVSNTALLWLVEKDSRKEERIFTDDEVRWW